MTPYYQSPYLAHFGVKGMKWGVRRRQKKIDKYSKKVRNYHYGPDSSDSDRYRAKIAADRAKIWEDSVKGYTKNKNPAGAKYSADQANFYRYRAKGYELHGKYREEFDKRVSDISKTSKTYKEGRKLVDDFVKQQNTAFSKELNDYKKELAGRYSISG